MKKKSKFNQLKLYFLSTLVFYFLIILFFGLNKQAFAIPSHSINSSEDKCSSDTPYLAPRIEIEKELKSACAATYVYDLIHRNSTFSFLRVANQLTTASYYKSSQKKELYLGLTLLFDDRYLNCNKLFKSTSLKAKQIAREIIEKYSMGKLHVSLIIVGPNGAKVTQLTPDNEDEAKEIKNIEKQLKDIFQKNIKKNAITVLPETKKYLDNLMKEKELHSTKIQNGKGYLTSKNGLKTTIYQVVGSCNRDVLVAVENSSSQAIYFNLFPMIPYR